MTYCTFSKFQSKAFNLDHFDSGPCSQTVPVSMLGKAAESRRHLSWPQALRWGLSNT